MSKKEKNPESDIAAQTEDVLTALDVMQPGAAEAAAEEGVISAEALADAAMAAALPAGSFTPTKPVIDAGLATLEGASLPTFFDVMATLRAMLAVVDTNLAIAALGAASAFAALALLEDLRATLRALQERYQPGAGALRLYTVPETMALWQVAVAVYGDASREGLILAANAIPDPLFVAAGTVLTVLPDDGS